MTANHHPHQSLWYYLFEGTYFLLQGASAKLQAIRIASNLPIAHAFYAGLMLLAGIVMVLSYRQITRCKWKEAVKLGASLLLIRFVSFTPWLNKVRHKPFFYLGKASIWDRLLAGWYRFAWVAGLIALIGLQII